MRLTYEINHEHVAACAQPIATCPMCSDAFELLARQAKRETIKVVCKAPLP